MDEGQTSLNPERSSLLFKQIGLIHKNRIVSHSLYSSIHKMRDRDSNSNLEWVPKLLRYNLIFIHGDNKNNLYYKKEPTLNKQ